MLTSSEERQAGSCLSGSGTTRAEPRLCGVVVVVGLAGHGRIRGFMGRAILGGDQQRHRGAWHRARLGNANLVRLCQGRLIHGTRELGPVGARWRRGGLGSTWRGWALCSEAKAVLKHTRWGGRRVPGSR